MPPDEVEACAARQVAVLFADSGQVVDPQDWLIALADQAYPDDTDAARLITCAADVAPGARRMIFNDGVLAVVLHDDSETDEDIAEALLAAYEYVRGTTDVKGAAPDAMQFLGGAENCLGAFTELVARWRSNFFKALLSEQQPWPPR